MKAIVIGAFLASAFAVPAFAQNVSPETFCSDARLKPIEQKDCREEMRMAKSDRDRQRVMASYYWVLNNMTPLRNDLRSEEAGVKGARRY
jgi:tRNA(His) 5'-end guanylyltransferase